jgi:hypothetical protein
VQQSLVPTVDRKRYLPQTAFAPSSTLSIPLPKDTVLKGLNIRLSGSIVTTYASGTPVADAQSTFANLITRMDVIVNGRTVKSVDPHMIQMQQLFTSVVQAERRASAGAAAATDNFPTVDQGFVYGTTGQTTTAAETVYLPFEMVYANASAGRESTWLNLKGVASAELRLTTGAYANLLGFGNTAPVVYSASTLSIEVSTKEAQDVPVNTVFSDWKQTLKTEQVTAEVHDRLIDLNKGNHLTGLMVFVKDGAAGAAGAASGKLASNLAITKWAVKVNGQTEIQSGYFKQQQAENRALYGVNAPMASNVSRLDGVMHINFLARRDLSTALDCRAPMVDNVQLSIDTNTAANVSYTNPLTIQIMTEELYVPAS